MRDTAQHFGSYRIPYLPSTLSLSLSRKQTYTHTYTLTFSLSLSSLLYFTLFYNTSIFCVLLLVLLLYVFFFLSQGNTSILWAELPWYGNFIHIYAVISAVLIVAHVSFRGLSLSTQTVDLHKIQLRSHLTLRNHR